jgi:hypothetical protein
MIALEWRLGDWRKAADARTLLGAGARLLASNGGQGFNFAAADLTKGDTTVRRSAVLVRDTGEAAAFLFDVASAPFSWRFPDADVSELQAPRPGIDTTCALACTEPAAHLKGVDVSGGVWRNWVVLFHTGLHAAQSSLSFDSDAGSRYLVTGLGPGSWDIWRNGWLDEMGVAVPPPAGSLRFDSEPGSFFLRKFG